MARRNILRRQLAPHYFRYFALILSLFRGGKTNIIVILRQNSETAQISHYIRSRYILVCGREHETSSMRPYVNLSFRNDNHIVVNPSLSNFKCSIQGQNKVKIGQVPTHCTENVGPGYQFIFFFRKLEHRYKLP